jgi:hypothetical protein
MATITFTEEQMTALKSLLCYLALDQEEMKHYFEHYKPEIHNYCDIKIVAEAIGIDFTEEEKEYEDQYKQQCEECDTTLTEDVQIECLEKKSGEEKVVCHTCWSDHKKELKEEGWARNTEAYEPSDDEESDNDE